ncbi:TonB-dependent receptor plug domain-containing protein [Methylophaga sp. OBS4]|uniref:TonB-dependent receptor plug domain-containing protein n=1 Tax=Methylophaga sp. OBS4 TaxID=2991935 RepID=UPI00225381D5|nr:TonB-dependent receptor [Methylophaga sp. OBS4]
MAVLTAFPLIIHANSDQYATADLTNLSLEQLSNLKITSVSKKPEKLSEASASIYVITADDIRRNGATTIPEVLRLAPNLQVAQVNANEYAISARGFNNTTANKLQVLIDGRIAYTPLFSGVFWDVQNVMLEDVERIEVISGANTTIWGSNAVNGVINIITRSASDTQGNLLAAGAGNLEQGLTFRHGGAFASSGHYRVYGKTFNIEETERESGIDAEDSWHNSQAGFRLDMPANGQLTIQSDAYDGRADQLTADTEEVRGINLLTRWQHDLGANEQLQLQAYYDRTERDRPGTFEETLDIIDIEMQHNLPLGKRHNFIWGAGYRSAWDNISNTAALAFLPADKHLSWSSLFAQDEISLTPDLRLTLGTRLEYNSYTDLEFMPNIRLGWSITPDHLLWTSLARSVRTPSRLDRELFFPGSPPFLLAGGPDFDSETVNSAEIGYRGNISSRFSYSVTAFYHDYDDLRTVEPTGNGTFVIDNGLEAESYGLEAWADLQVTDNWLLKAGALVMHQNMQLKPGSNDINEGQAEANDPSNQWQLHSSHQLSSKHELDITLRHVGELDRLDVPAYTTVDIRFGRHITPDTELSVTGKNLLDPQHPEFGALATRSEVERSIYLKLVHRF